MEHLKVLIVDDEAELAAMLALRLRAAGLDARVAADGALGLAQARAWRPDVVLTDISMPELDGWQLCEALRRHEALRAVPILAMTAWATADLESRARAAGADGFLLKPFDERKLAGLLRSVVADRRCGDVFIRG